MVRCHFRRICRLLVKCAGITFSCMILLRIIHEQPVYQHGGLRYQWSLNFKNWSKFTNDKTHGNYSATNILTRRERVTQASTSKRLPVTHAPIRKHTKQGNRTLGKHPAHPPQIKYVKRPGKVTPKKSTPPYGSRITYPLDIDMNELIRRVDAKKPLNVKPINHHDFNYIYNPSFHCQNRTVAPFLVILVKSAVENFRKREAIRNTWGNVTKWKNVALVFLLGYAAYHSQNISKEYNKYQDVVCEDFSDTYWNNTHKMIMGFRWAVTYCSRSKYFFYVDDDYFVNVENIVSYLQKERNLDVFTGFKLPRSQPFRDVGGKWYVSVEDYPHNHYPPYLAGGAYITSYSVARMFNIVFPFVKYLVIDDAYLGIVAQKLNITPKHNSKFMYSKGGLRTNKNAILACHGYSDTEKLIADWKMFSNGKVLENSVRYIRNNTNPSIKNKYSNHTGDSVVNSGKRKKPGH